MTRHQLSSKAGYTLVELLVGVSLSLVVLAAVLSTYTFLGRNLIRLANQQGLDAEARRALDYFKQDTRMASAITNPSETALTFTRSTSTGNTTATYNYYSTATTVGGLAIAAGSLTRTTPASSTPLILLRNLQTFSFTYYNGSDVGVTDFTNKISSIKKVAVTFTSQTGDATLGTLTPVYKGASPRLSIRNKPLLN